MVTHFRSSTTIFPPTITWRTLAVFWLLAPLFGLSLLWNFAIVPAVEWLEVKVDDGLDTWLTDVVEWTEGE